jgi:hypothetical protein
MSVKLTDTSSVLYYSMYCTAYVKVQYALRRVEHSYSIPYLLCEASFTVCVTLDSLIELMIKSSTSSTYTTEAPPPATMVHTRPL